MYKTCLKTLCLLTFFIVFTFRISFSEVIELTLSTHGNYEYFHELLEQSLESVGHTVTITKLPSNYNQKRIMKMLEEGDSVTLHWRGRSPKQDQKFIPVEFDLTEGLKGHRVFFIQKGKQSDFDRINTLDDFIKLGKVGGFGKGWSDVAIWQYNNLKTYEKDGKWDPQLHKMVASGNRGIDYFSRGIIEIAVEAPQHPYLDVESNLVFIYDRDFRFYLSKQNARLKPIIETALGEAQKSGLLGRLLRKHYSDVFDKDKLNLDGRKKIYLKLPW